MDRQLILSALLSFCLFLASIAVLFRITRQEAAIVWMIRAFIGIGGAVVWVFAGSWGLTEYIWWASLYGLFTILFVFGVFSIMEASLTLRIFTEIASSDSGMAMTQLMKRYNRPRIIRRRIARLLYSGEIKKTHGMYTCGNISYFGVREIFLEFLRRLFPQ